MVAELASWVHTHDAYPTTAALRRGGQSALESARARLWAGEANALRAAVAEATGTILAPRRAPDGAYATNEQVAAALRPLAQRLGRMPTQREAAAAGLGTAWAESSRRVGVAGMAARLGVPCRTRQTHDRTGMLAGLVGVALARRGRRLTTQAVRQALGSLGIAWIRRCGGIAAVRVELARMGIRHQD